MNKALLRSWSPIVFVCALSAVSCSPESPKLTPQIPKVEKVTTGQQVQFNPRVDILFVIDDSGSMDTHQKNLKANIDLFTEGIRQSKILDYHIGVITSTFEGKYVKRGTDGILVGKTDYYVDRSTVDADSILRTNLGVGTNGSGTEMFFDPAKLALISPNVTGMNAGFYRQDAALVLIFITDADDQSKSLNAKKFYEFLLSLKNGDKAKIIPYGVFIPSSQSNSDCSRSGESSPTRIEEFMALAQGLSFGLCDKDYGNKLAALASDLVKKVAKYLYLAHPANPSTIQIRFGTDVIPNDPVKGWMYDPMLNAIVLGDDIDWASQPYGTQLEVNYLPGTYDN